MVLGSLLVTHGLPSGIERPIAFASSRSLSKCELGYSQIDKEQPTVIYWTLKKFLILQFINLYDPRFWKNFI